MIRFSSRRPGFNPRAVSVVSPSTSNTSVIIPPMLQKHLPYLQEDEEQARNEATFLWRHLTPPAIINTNTITILLFFIFWMGWSDVSRKRGRWWATFHYLRDWLTKGEHLRNDDWRRKVEEIGGKPLPVQFIRQKFYMDYSRSEFRRLMWEAGD